MVLRVELPDEALKVAGLTGETADRQAAFLILLELYREEKISLGKLGELAGLSQFDLLDRMRAHGTYLNYSAADLEEDRRTLG